MKLKKAVTIDPNSIQKAVANGKKINPFLSESLIPYKHKTETKRRFTRTKIDGEETIEVIKKNTGEIEEWQEFYSLKRVDDRQFLKVYIDTLSKFLELSGTHLKIILYAMTELRFNTDEMIINAEHLAKISGVSIQTVYRALDAAEKKEIIAPSFQFQGQKRTNIYFINVNLLFNGNAFTLLNKYKTKSELKLTDVIYKLKNEDKATGNN